MTTHCISNVTFMKLCTEIKVCYKRAVMFIFRQSSEMKQEAKLSVG